MNPSHRFRLVIGFLAAAGAIGAGLIVQPHVYQVYHGENGQLLENRTDPRSPIVVEDELREDDVWEREDDKGEVATTSVTRVIEANATVIRVIDGDTLFVRLDQQEEEWTVRMLGTNTPETVDPRKPVQCFGKEASQKMHDLVEGKRVRLEADPQADERDKYGRLLRTIFLEDGTDVNAKMIQDGYAYAYLSFPLTPSRKQELKNLQDEARGTGAGLWATSTCSGKL